jgi:hypothetical protein
MFYFEPSLDISNSKIFGSFKTIFHTKNNQQSDLCPISIWAISYHLSLAQLSWYSDSLQDGCSDHRASYKMGTESFLRGKVAGAWY